MGRHRIAKILLVIGLFSLLFMISKPNLIFDSFQVKELKLYFNLIETIVLILIASFLIYDFRSLPDKSEPKERIVKILPYMLIFWVFTIIFYHWNEYFTNNFKFLNIFGFLYPFPAPGQYIFILLLLFASILYKKFISPLKVKVDLKSVKKQEIDERVDIYNILNEIVIDNLLIVTLFIILIKTIYFFGPRGFENGFIGRIILSFSYTFIYIFFFIVAVTGTFFIISMVFEKYRNKRINQLNKNAVLLGFLIWYWFLCSKGLATLFFQRFTYAIAVIFFLNVLILKRGLIKLTFSEKTKNLILDTSFIILAIIHFFITPLETWNYYTMETALTISWLCLLLVLAYILPNKLRRNNNFIPKKQNDLNKRKGNNN